MRFIYGHHRRLCHVLCGFQNRAVTGAAAEVARQGFLRGGACHRLALAHPVLVQAKQAHGKTGGAKTALAGVALVQGLLHRMRRAIWRGQVGSRPQRHAVNRMCQPNAAVDCQVADAFAMARAQHHGAGPAIAFVAAFLGGAVAQVLSQHLQQCAGR